MRIKSQIYKKLPGRLTKAVDAYQIWDDQLDGWPSRSVRFAMSAGGMLWTWLGESWLPMAVVVGVSVYMLTRRLVPFVGRSPGETAAKDAENGDTPPADSIPKAASSAAQQAAYTETLTRLAAQIERLEQGIVRNNAKIYVLERDVTVLLETVAHDVGLEIFSRLMNDAPRLDKYFEQPEITKSWLDDQEKLAEDYISYVEQILDETYWLFELKKLMSQVDDDADREVRRMLAQKQPKDIDSLDLKAYVTAAKKCDQAIRFIRQKKLEAEDKQQNHLQRLWEQEALKRNT